MDIINQSAEMVDVTSLSTHPRNPRKGDVKAIAESIKQNGFYGVVIAQRSTGHVLAGNHRFLAAQQAGAARLPVVWLDVDDEKAVRIMLADNKLAEHATYDDAKLKSLLDELVGTTAGIKGVGYSNKDLQALAAKLKPVDLDVDKMSAPPEEPNNGQAVGGEEPSHVRMVQLFLNEQTVEEFTALVQDLQGHYATDNLTATVMEAIREAHRTHVAN